MFVTYLFLIIIIDSDDSDERRGRRQGGEDTSVLVWLSGPTRRRRVREGIYLYPPTNKLFLLVRTTHRIAVLTVSLATAAMRCAAELSLMGFTITSCCYYLYVWWYVGLPSLIKVTVPLFVDLVRYVWYIWYMTRWHLMGNFAHAN